MLSDANTARKISDLMLGIFYRIDESVAEIKGICPPDEAAAYQKAAGRVACAVVMDVLEPLYDKHPMLKPNNWDE